MSQSKVNLLRKTLQAAASLRGGDISSVTAPLSNTWGSSDTPVYGWDPNSFFQGWQGQGGLAGPLFLGAQALPNLSSRQQDGSGSPRQGWPSMQHDSASQQQGWSSSSLLDLPTPSHAPHLVPPAGPCMPIPPPTQGQLKPTKDAAPSRALLASLLSRKTPTDASRVLEQAAAKKQPPQLGTHHAAGRRPLHQQSLHAPTRNPGARGNARSIALNKDITATATIDQLLSLVTAHGHEFDFFNISTAISRMPKLVGDHTQHGHVGQHGPSGHRTEHDMKSTAGVHGGAGVANASANAAHLSSAVKEVADRLCVLALRHVHEFDGRGLANTAWAFAKLRYVPDPALPAALCRASVARIDQFAAQNVSNLAWALVYLHYQDEQLMQLIKSKACEQVYDMKPQELANMMWALASHEQLDVQTAQVLGQRAARLAPQFKEQELSNVVWALGRCGHTHEPQVLEPLLAVVRAKIGSFMPQGVSNMVWALGQLGHHDPALLAALTRECPQQLHSYDAQALSNLATGLSALGRTASPTLMAAVAHEAGARGQRMPPQHLATVMAAAASLGVANDRLLAAAADTLHSRAASLEPSTLAALAGAAVSLGAHMQPPSASAGSLLAPLAHAVVACADKLHGQALASLVVHFSQLGESVAAQVLPALAARLPAAMPSLTHQQITAVTRALQQAGALTVDVVPALLRHAMMPPTHLGQEEDYVSQLTVAVSAAARVGFCPPEAHMREGLLTAVRSALPHMDVEQLCSSCWSLSAMGVLDTETLNAFNAVLEGHAASGAMAHGELGSLQVQQMFDAHVLVAAQLSQRLGLPLTAVPAHLLPALPPLVERAVAQHSAALMALAQPSQDIDSPLSTMDMQAGNPLAATLHFTQAPPPPPPTRPQPTLKPSEAAAFTPSSLASVQDRADLDFTEACYDIGAGAVLNASQQALAAFPRDIKPRGKQARKAAIPRSASASQFTPAAHQQQASGRAGMELAHANVHGWTQAANGVWNVGGLGNGQLTGARQAVQTTMPVAERLVSASVSSEGSQTDSNSQSVTPTIGGRVQAVGQPPVLSNASAAAAMGSVEMGRSDSLEDVGGGWWLPRDLLTAGPSVSVAAIRPQ